MAEDFLSGMMSGIKGAGSEFLGLLGGSPEGASADRPDPYAQMSPEEQRRMTVSMLGQLGATLLAAGQRQTPAQRGQILAQLGNIGPGMEQQIQRSAQMRAQMLTAQRQRELFPLELAQKQAQLRASQQQQELYPLERQQIEATLGQKQAEMRELEAIRERQRSDPEGLAAALGGVSVDYVRAAGASDLVAIGRQVQAARATARPQGGLDERSQQMIIAAQRNPEVANTPEYAMAFNNVFGPKQVQAFNPSTNTMEYQWTSPPVPAGVLQPQGMQQQGMQPAAGQVAPGAPPAGQFAPIISARPVEEKYTEEENKSAKFARRMISAMGTLNPLDSRADVTKPSMLENVVGSKVGPDFIGFLRGDERQSYEQAKVDWVRANLRSESGAAIGVDEMSSEIRNYFPVPGDNAGTIEQKRRAREAATLGMIGASGKAAKRDQLSYSPYTPTTRERIRSMSEPELSSLDPSQLSAPEKAEYLARLKQINGRR